MTRDPFVVWSHRARFRDRFLPLIAGAWGFVVGVMFAVAVVVAS